MGHWDNVGCDVSELRGKILSRVYHENRRDERIVFETVDGERYQMLHYQDCCENVYVESIVGDLQDLVGSPILQAEVVSAGDEPPANDYEPESYTWTFYKLATIKGGVTIRWYGSSNGYYSESVDFERIV